MVRIKAMNHQFLLHFLNFYFIYKAKDTQTPSMNTYTGDKIVHS